MEGCDRDSTEAVISVPVRAAARRGGDWKDSKTSNLGDLMHRVPDDCNVLQLSAAAESCLLSHTHTHTQALHFELFLSEHRFCDLQVKRRGG